MPNVSETLSQKGFAALCDVSPQTVSNWCEAGMPNKGGGGHGETRSINVRQAIPWVVANRTEKPGSERERLAREQADKVALENAKTRGEHIIAQQVEDALAAAIAGLASQLDGHPGRMATPLASIDDPALIRSKLQDETRRIRDTYARQLTELVDNCRDIRKGRADHEPAAKADGKRVGRAKQGSTTRKRRARSVAK